MRGSKGGLETLIRQRKSPNLLDIDGDTCHHAQNASKQFCKAFDGHVENILADIHTDFKWSAEQLDLLGDLCEILGIKPTKPERYVPHRWLSVLKVTMDTLRLFDAFTLFYYSFLPADDKCLYADVLEEVLSRREVSSVGRKTVKKVQTTLAAKVRTFIKEGRNRKQRLLQGIFFDKEKTLLVIHLYNFVLPSLKNYTLVFQSKDPLIHLLHSKQDELLQKFLSHFFKPEKLIQGDLTKVDLKDEKGLRSLSSMNIGQGVENILAAKKLGKKDNGSIAFLKTARSAYIQCGQYLQRKMPVNNPVLKVCSSLDPEVRGSTTTLNYLLRLPAVTKLLGQNKETLGDFKTQAEQYMSDRTLSGDSKLPIDQWWASVSEEKYLLVCKAPKALLSAFHGPKVESSFSVMGHLLHTHAGQTDIETFSSMQTVKSFLVARNLSAVNFFAKKTPLEEQIDGALLMNMRGAFKRNEERKQEQE